jgi:CBS domain-containing protein
MTRPATVKDFTAPVLITVTPETDIHRAIRILLERQISGMPVIDGKGELVGFLSVKDCLKIAFSASYHQEWAGRVSEFMSADVRTIESDTDIVTAAEIFVKSKYRIFPVVTEGRLVGVISRYDVLRALEELW